MRGLHIDIKSKKYGLNIIFKNLEMRLQDGKIYGVIGKNGCGKTTLFECICGLRSFEGSVKHNIYSDFKNVIGYLATETSLIPRITAEEYIHFCLKARNKKVNNLKESNKLFNLPLRRYATKFSTGMKKKLNFHILLLQDNQYYLLDEPFNGIDIETSIVFKQIILDLKRKGKTVILSSHILAAMTEVADEIFLLDNQKVHRHYMSKEFSLLEKDIATSVFALPK